MGKELLLQNRMKSCSAPPSIMAGSLEGGSGGGLADRGEELSNEWEVKSSGGSSVHSEVSVACLQDKLVQMEENNYQQLKLQVEVQQKMISDYEASKVGYDQKMAELTTELARREQETKVLREELHGKKRLEILIQDLREKLQYLESENRNLQQRVNESSPLTDHQKELLLQNFK